MVPAADAATATGYSHQQIARICRDHGPDGTDRVRCEKRHGKLWYVYVPDVQVMLDAGVLRGPY